MLCGQKLFLSSLLGALAGLIIKLTLKNSILYNSTNELNIILTKYMLTLFAENYKTLRKDVKEDLNKWIYYVHRREGSILL